MLKDFSSFCGWNWEELSFKFPAHIQLDIKATPLPFSNQGGDRLSWFSSPNGEFKLKEAYRLANWEANKEIGHFKVLLCLPFLCPMCINAPETIIHTLRDCPTTQTFWNSLNCPIQRNLFYGTSLVSWLNLNCHSSKNSTISSIEWSILFPFALWTLWLHRNNIVFGRAPNHQDLKAETLAKATEFLYIGINGKQIRTRQTIQVRWLCPPTNWFKLNTDESSLGNPGLASGGGLIRNEKGEWIKGFAYAIRTVTSLVAEFWALKDGIRLCITLKLPAVEIELDSKLVVDLLKKDLNNPNDNDVLVADCGNRDYSFC